MPRATTPTLFNEALRSQPVEAGSARAAGRPAANGFVHLAVSTLPQPDETTCGPTCLHAIYRYWGRGVPLADVIARTHRFPHGGTLAVFLGCDALRQGYRARIYTCNLLVFDPSWFVQPRVDLAERLQRQQEVKSDRRLQQATEGYLEFLALGGRIRLANVSQQLIRGILHCKLPILTGLSATYLYRSPREYGDEAVADDLRGLPAGHFVVIAGWDPARRRVLVIDPYQPNPYGRSHSYWMGIDRVVGAVLLGIVTHDANLLVIYPAGGGQHA
jgi:hypothetical protein